MYKPSDDTFFISDVVSDKYHGYSAMEIGVGSGYLTRILCSNYKFVIGTDIDINSLIYTKKSLVDYNNKLLVCCDIDLPIRYKFDLIVSNPPYLPADNENIKDDTIYGGKTGIETTIRILRSVKSNLKEDGKIVIVKSSLSGDKDLELFISKNSFEKRIIAKRSLFYETLEIIELMKKKEAVKKI